VTKLVKKVKLIVDFSEGLTLSEAASFEEVLKEVIASSDNHSTKIKVEFNDESKAVFESNQESNADKEDSSYYTAPNKNNPTLFL
jgi:hypothetical protein